MKAAAGDHFDLTLLSHHLRTAGVTKPIGLGAVEIGSGALERLPRVVEGLIQPSSPGPIVILDDGVLKSRRDEDVTDLAAACLTGLRPVHRVVVGSGTGRVHADTATLDTATRQAAGAVCIVATGSGTVADIGKAVSARLGAPYVVVQTALSVNGFADDQSVLLVDGVKRTTPTRWPDALIADTETLAEAPGDLNAAGVGDLAAMFTAPADWLLANLLGMANGYSPAVVTMVREHGTALLDAGAKLAARDPAAIDFVAQLLTLSGISMGVAGTTAPSSGMEHTVSHLIEMAMNRRGLESAFHGAQVGVCAVLAALVWKRVRAAMGSDTDLALLFPAEDTMAKRVRAAFQPVDPSGAMGEECWRLYRRKLTRWNETREDLADIDWSAIDRAVAPLLVEPSDLARALVGAGAPVRFRDLAPPIDSETVSWALTNCHLMRDRFTVADLAFFLGIWGPSEVEATLADATALGAGL